MHVDFCNTLVELSLLFMVPVSAVHFADFYPFLCITKIADGSVKVCVN